MLPRCCFSLSLLCVHQLDTTRAICLFQPRPSDLSAYGPHLVTFGMPRAVVVVSSVIPLYFGLLSRNYTIHAKLYRFTTRGFGITNYMPVNACTHTMHALRLSRLEQVFYRPFTCAATEIPCPHYLHHV